MSGPTGRQDSARLPGTVELLLRGRVRMVLNTAFRQSRERRGWTTIIAILVASGMTASYLFAGAIFDGAAPDGGDGLIKATAGALTLLAGFTAVTSITFALGSLYFAKDLDLLLSAPLPPRVVILSRIYTQLGLGVGLATIIAGPPLLAYTLAIHAVWAMPLLAVSVAGLVSIPLTLATGFTIVALRLVPARYARDAGGLVVTVAVFSVAAINLLLRGPEGFTGKIGALPFAQIGAGLSGSPWSPIGWAARAVVGALHGDVSAWLTWSAPLVLAGGALPWLLARSAEQAYLSGYQRNATASARPRRQQRIRSGRRLASNLPTWLVIAAKDLRGIRRDPSQMGQLLLPLVLFAFYLGRPGGNSLSAGGLPPWFLIALNASLASLLFAANIALRGVGTEGQRMWLLRIPPVRSRDILAAKYVAGFVIAALPACCLLWVGEARANSGVIGLIEPTVWVCVMIAGVVAIAVGLGAVRPRLDWTDPRRAVGIGLTLLYLAIGATYLVACFIILGVPYAFAAGRFAEVMVSDAAMVVFTLAVSAGALILGGRRLGRLEV